MASSDNPTKRNALASGVVVRGQGKLQMQIKDKAQLRIVCRRDNVDVQPYLIDDDGEASITQGGEAVVEAIMENPTNQGKSSATNDIAAGNAETSSKQQASSGDDGKVNITVRVEEKSVVERLTTRSTSKIMDVKLEILSRHPGIDFALLNSHRQQLDESKTLKENGVRDGDTLKAARLQVISSGHRQTGQPTR